MNRDEHSVIQSPLKQLKEYTGARVALGRCGSSLTTGDLLDFKLCHARARDAVHIPLDFDKISAEISAAAGTDIIYLESMAEGRDEYLRRPDFGRRLSERSIRIMNTLKEEFDISISVADGLSSMAIDKNSVQFLSMLLPSLRKQYTVAPVALVRHGRVAIADEIAHAFHAKLAIILIGERPGLKSPDSMGLYMTYAPEPGTTDERRNCISNIRPGGLSCSAGVSKLLYLINESMSKKLSGVELKDEQDLPLMDSSEERIIGLND